MGITARLFGRLNICARMGALAGVVVGFLYGLLMLQAGGGLPTTVAVQAGIALGLVGLALVLFVFGFMEHFGVGAVIVPAVLVSLLTGLLTALVLNVVGLQPVPPVVGILIGILVGLLVCRVRCGGLRGQAREAYRKEVSG